MFFVDRASRGRLGEDLALGFLQYCGYECLARRWRRAGGEIDLVMTRPGILVFVEVKMRGPGSLGSAVESAGSEQIGRLRRMAGRWCHEHANAGAALRIDVVTVDLAGEGRGLVLRHFPAVG
jgi:putative endonuclease